MNIDVKSAHKHAHTGTGAHRNGVSNNLKKEKSKKPPEANGQTSFLL